jgi:hypothetical protein
MTSRFVAVLVATALLLPSTAQAYIDPGTGSLLVQVLVAAAMGILMAVKMYWARIKSFFSRQDPSDTAGQSQSDG